MFNTHWMSVKLSKIQYVFYRLQCNNAEASPQTPEKEMLFTESLAQIVVWRDIAERIPHKVLHGYTRWYLGICLPAISQ